MDGNIGYAVIIFMAGGWCGFMACALIKGSNVLESRQGVNHDGQ